MHWNGLKALMEVGVHGDAGDHVQKPAAQDNKQEPEIVIIQHPNLEPKTALQMDQRDLNCKIATPKLVHLMEDGVHGAPGQHVPTAVAEDDKQGPECVIIQHLNMEATTVHQYSALHHESAEQIPAQVMKVLISDKQEL